jgi:hypothetical protein
LAIIPGVTGQKAELFDGAKIDAISEYTAGNGVQLQGRTNGTAIEAGKVGEVIPFSNLTSTSTITDGAGITQIGSATITLGAGFYFVSYAGDGTGSDATVRLYQSWGTVSGTAVVTAMGPLDAFVGADTAGFAIGFTSSAYIRVTASVILKINGQASGGNVTGARIQTGAAIRIA